MRKKIVNQVEALKAELEAELSKIPEFRLWLTLVDNYPVRQDSKDSPLAEIEKPKIKKEGDEKLFNSLRQMKYRTARILATYHHFGHVLGNGFVTDLHLQAGVEKIPTGKKRGEIVKVISSAVIGLRKSGKVGTHDPHNDVHRMWYGPIEWFEGDTPKPEYMPKHE